MKYLILIFILVSGAFCESNEEKILQYCTKKAQKFTNEAIYKHTLANCKKEFLDKNLLVSDIDKIIEQDNIQAVNREEKIKKAAEKREKENEIKKKREELLKNTGIWYLLSYKDEFKGNKEVRLITNLYDIIGKFSNTATTNSILKVDIAIHSSDDIGIRLYEYGGKNAVKKLSDESYAIEVLDKLGNKYDLEAKIYGSSLTLNKKDSNTLHNIFLNGGAVKFRIYDKRYVSSWYYFTVETDFYYNAYVNL